MPNAEHSIINPLINTLLNDPIIQNQRQALERNYAPNGIIYGTQSVGTIPGIENIIFQYREDYPKILE
jgi:hypothetical protein